MINVVIPSFIMMKLSNEEYLGQVYGLVIALSFPLLYGIYDLVKLKKFNFFSGLGLFSILVTGGIGLFNLDRNWMIAKETAIPAIMGVVVVITQWMGKPLVRGFFDQMIELDKINEAFEEKGHPDEFEKTLSTSSYMLAGTFFISAILNFVLAVAILKGQPGSVEFNESLGKMTVLSFPVITAPMMVMVGIILWNIFRNVKSKTDLDIESVFRQ